MRSSAALLAAFVAFACRSNQATHDHDHAHDHAHAESDEPEPIAITRWSEAHELFVEFPPPEPGKRVAFHAHVTKLDDFSAVSAGRFTVRFEKQGRVAAETSVDKVARAGIFTPELRAPDKGTYELVMSYESGAEKSTFRCGTIDVPEKRVEGTASAGEISFLKEAQWKIDFRTAFAGQHLLARELELPATVEPAGTDRLSIGAPTSGRFFHPEKTTLAEGQDIKKGTILGSISPNVEGDDFSSLELAVDRAEIAKQRVERELARVRPLVAEGLLPDKRIPELESQRAEHEAELASARRRLGRVLAPGARGGVPIRSTLDGLIAEVLVPNGEPVEAGATLLRLRGTRELWLRARFVARAEGELEGAAPVALRAPDGTRRPLGADARFVSREPAIDPETRVATWIARTAETTLSVGQSAVLIVRVGEPKPATAVPREAIVDIDTQSYVFVQTGGESFVKRRVELGRSDAGFVEILSGAQPGERVVTRGGFDVHLASLAGTVESHRH